MKKNNGQFLCQFFVRKEKIVKKRSGPLFMKTKQLQKYVFFLNSCLQKAQTIHTTFFFTIFSLLTKKLPKTDLNFSLNGTMDGF